MNYRTLERSGYCRGCDKLIEKNTEKLISIYSHRNRGQHIYLCKDCVDKMVKLISDNKEIKSREKWAKSENYKYLRKDRNDKTMSYSDWIEEVYEKDIDNYK